MTNEYETVFSDSLGLSIMTWMSLHSTGVLHVGNHLDVTRFDLILNAGNVRQRLFSTACSVRIDAQFFGPATALFNGRPLRMGLSDPDHSYDTKLRRYRFEVSAQAGDLLTFSKDPFEIAITHLPS